MPSDVVPSFVRPNGDGWERFTDALGGGQGLLCAEIGDWFGYLPLADRISIAERQLASFLLHRSAAYLQDIACKTGNAPLESSLFRDHYGRPRIGIGDVNLSHSGGKVAVIAALYGSVGIDIEPCNRRLLEKSFHVWSREEERSWVETIVPEKRLSSIVRLWTAKEAYAKAIGLGLNLPFRKVIVRPGWPSGHIGFTDDAFRDESPDDVVTWSDAIPGFIISFVKISHDKARFVKQFMSKNLFLEGFDDIGNVS